MYDQDMYGNDGYRPRPRGGAMGRFSLYLGVSSIILCLMFYLSIPLGALAIICALLARTDSPRSKKYRISVICGFCGIALSLGMMISVFYRVATDPQMRSYIEYYVRVYTGDYDWDLEEEMGGLFPFSVFFGDDEASEGGGDGIADDNRDGDTENGGADTGRGQDTDDAGSKDPAPGGEEKEPSDSQNKGGVFI